jgi:hypothetical protein
MGNLTISKEYKNKNFKMKFAIVALIAATVSALQQKGDKWLEAQTLVHNNISAWAEPQETQLGDDGEEQVDDWKTFRDSFSDGEEKGGRSGAKGLNSKRLFQIG